MDLVLLFTDSNFKLIYILLFLSWSPIMVFGDETLLYCYQCHSEKDDYCEFINGSSSVHYKPCVSPEPSTPPFCRKIVQKIYPRDNLQIVFRKCGWIADPRPCYRVRNFAHAETVCQCFSDGCNKAGSLNAPSATLSLLITVLLKNTLFYKHF